MYIYGYMHMFYTFYEYLCNFNANPRGWDCNPIGHLTFASLKSQMSIPSVFTVVPNII